MATLVLDRDVEARIKAEREASGADRFDEVWEGVYMMAPLADDEHQKLQLSLGTVFQLAVGWAGLGEARAGVNVSDRDEGWIENYRIPDVAVFLPGGAGRNCDTHWVGGPDFAVEIVSTGDRSRAKLDFYAANGLRELLLVDRSPWSLELYRRDAAGNLQLVGRSAPSPGEELSSNLVPLSFRLVAGVPRPKIEVTHRDGVQRWTL